MTSSSPDSPANEYRIRRKLMGSSFELIIAEEPSGRANECLEQGVQEIIRLENLLSEYKEDSVTSLVNRNAGIRSVKVPEEFYKLVQRSLHLSRITQGAFDISTRPLKKLYDFRKRSLTLPDRALLQSTLEITGSGHIRLSDGNRIYLTKRGMEISFASNGKGYAADRVRKIWTDGGIRNGVVNASGDLSVLGSNADGSPWKVGIADPEDRDRILLYLPLKKGAVATSGDYEQYFEYNGRRYAHTLDPATGMPVTGIKSVTVSGISAELCDGLATAVTVMGVEAGLYFIDQLPETHCLIIDGKNNLHFSKNITFERVS